MSFWNDPPRLLDADTSTRPELVRALRSLRNLNGTEAEVQAGAQRLGAKLAAGTVVATGAKGIGLLGSCGIMIGGALVAGLFAVAHWHSTPEMHLNEKPGALTAHPSAATDASTSAPALKRIPAPEPMPTRAHPVPIARDPRLARMREQPEHPRPPAESELALLERSQAALAHDPARALTLAEQHAREYPRGVLSEEREVLVIEALFKLHENQSTIVRAERFLRFFPASPHRLRVQTLLDRLRAPVQR